MVVNLQEKIMKTRFGMLKLETNYVILEEIIFCIEWKESCVINKIHIPNFKQGNCEELRQHLAGLDGLGLWEGQLKAIWIWGV